MAGAKKQENLRKAVPEMPLTRQLVTLKTDVPLDLTWDQWRLREWDAPKLLQLFKEWGFRSFAEQVRTSSPRPVEVPKGEVVQGSLFDPADGINAEPPPKDAWDYSKYQLVDTPEKFAVFKEELAKQTLIAVDLETTGLDPLRADLVGLAFSWRAGEASYLAVRGPEGEPVLDAQTVLAELKPLLEGERPAKFNQNIKYDLLVFRHHGINLGGVIGDPMIAHYVLHADEREHNMEALSRGYLHHEVIPITDLIGKRAKNSCAWIKCRRNGSPSIRVKMPMSLCSCASGLNPSWRKQGSGTFMTTWRFRSLAFLPSWSSTASASMCNGCGPWAKKWPAQLVGAGTRDLRARGPGIQHRVAEPAAQGAV